MSDEKGMESLGQRKFGKILIDTTLQQQEDLFRLVEELQAQLECYNKLQVLILESFAPDDGDLKEEHPDIKCENEADDYDSREDVKDSQDSYECEREKSEPEEAKEIKVKKRRKGMKYKTKIDPDGEHVCDSCGDVVQGLAAYRRHRRRHTEAGAHFKMVTKLCPHCSQEITTNAGR